jgi:hypothetical protein
MEWEVTFCFMAPEQRKEKPQGVKKEIRNAQTFMFNHGDILVNL